ncbi:MAG TPA: MBL fold metallo-hydrolase [Candidatus Fermentibacter daniensis]|nr:MAG: putative polyketide biosynthesis zinc-dependent hydrolase BaeB [candidate division Hyd24-12 bacterium ADurb.Bin004]HOA05535.1 MBL fold metallo-hydrolase [Candidatus Fermentibacter daniensis]HOF67421.1 MBL fold metallo-hydrolase [Candidatus Fermentibacter daniensis]HOG54100.1 MBL fold metallo-hydrolase [Candidatus Fermentibacter daniensis]HOZ18093.1 MBL fold metallo-hydrolase [Candidatus Fermentibacter daniensis]
MEIRSTGVARDWSWTRCYLAGDPETRDAILVDPSTTNESERSGVEAMVSGWRVGIIVLTHGHLDHISDARYWRDRLGARLAGHPADLPMFENPALNASAFFGKPISTGPLDIDLVDGGTLRSGSLECTVIHLPGHSPGSVGLLFPGHLFSGDTLFKGSVGVVSLPGIGDLWGASMETEIDSIRRKIFALPPSTVVHPGHGPDTTVGEEMRSNPFAAVP